MSCKIVFMGTPSFAVPCLSRLLADGFDVVGVFSQPDRPRGRGNHLAAPPVKELALTRNIPVYQPAKMRDGEALRVLKSLAPDLAVVVAFGRVLPPELLAVPKLGCVNVHASLLPKLRGAAPIQWAVIQGLAATGVSTMFIAEELDAGDIILQRETAIAPEETAGELFERLSLLGADCLSETVPLLLAGTAPRRAQDHAAATWAPPLEKSAAWLDFTASPAALRDRVRGLNPAPMAKTRLDGKMLKILKVRPADPGLSGAPGQVLDPARLIVACGGGAVELVTVQPEGKRPMTGAQFANGRRLCGGERFESGAPA